MVDQQPPYSWQTKPWQALIQAASTNRLHHAYLVVGPAGVGKLDFAEHLSRALLCSEDPKKSPCNECSRCALTTAGTHPDITTLDWIDTARVINVDQIRKLTEQLRLTTTYGPHRVAVINKAHTMTNAAANSLLPQEQEALAWLKAQKVQNAEMALEFAHGAPLLARSRSAEIDLRAISELISII